MTVEEQKAFVRDNYLKLPLKRIAKIIGRSNCFVSGELRRQGLVVPPEIIEKFKQESRFKKGRTPQNKGKKMDEFMTPEQLKKFRNNQYKKGHKPKNTLYDFAIRLRRNYKRGQRYYWIRMGEGNWVMLHRYLWELRYGKIPKGWNIQFKDGNPLNCQLDNLYMVNRRTQATHNKFGGKKLTYDMRKTITLIHSLKRKIDEKQNDRSEQSSIRSAGATE